MGYGMKTYTESGHEQFDGENIPMVLRKKTTLNLSEGVWKSVVLPSEYMHFVRCDNFFIFCTTMIGVGANGEYLPGQTTISVKPYGNGDAYIYSFGVADKTDLGYGVSMNNGKDTFSDFDSLPLIICAHRYDEKYVQTIPVSASNYAVYPINNYSGGGHGGDDAIQGLQTRPHVCEFKWVEGSKPTSTMPDQPYKGDGAFRLIADVKNF